MEEQQIIYKKITELKPYENNPRFNEDAIDKVAESIKSFGFKVPMIITKDNVIVSGHTRYLACKKLKIKEVPCVIAKNLTDQQIKAFRIADNKTAERADWNFDMLNEEILGLKESDFDITPFGFEDIEAGISILDFDLEAEGDYKIIILFENENLIGKINEIAEKYGAKEI